MPYWLSYWLPYGREIATALNERAAVYYALGPLYDMACQQSYKIRSDHQLIKTTSSSNYTNSEHSRVAMRCGNLLSQISKYTASKYILNRSNSSRLKSRKIPSPNSTSEPIERQKRPCPETHLLTPVYTSPKIHCHDPPDQDISKSPSPSIEDRRVT